MSESNLPNNTNRPRRRLELTLQGARWRATTWWPSDSRTSMQRSLLRILSVAHSQRLDPAVLIANFADEHRGGHRRRLRRLARRLQDGTPLVDALEQTPDVLRDEDVLAIRFAHQTGTLSSTYQYLLDRSNDPPGGVSARLSHTLAYFVCLSIVMVVLLSFLMIMIVPMLRQIYEEFGLTEVPWPFRWLVGGCEFLVDYLPLWILLGLIVAWLIWSPPSRRFFRRAVATRWIRDVAQARSAELLRLLSMAVDAGRPLPGALSTLARYHFDQSFRQRLLFARNEVEQGADVWASLVEAQLLTPQESHALAQSSSSRSRVWTMRRLADWKQQQLGLRREELATFVHPAVTLLFALIVLLICSAMFSLLAQIIQMFA